MLIGFGRSIFMFAIEGGRTFSFYSTMILTYKTSIFWILTTALSSHVYYSFSRFDRFTSIDAAAIETYDYVIVGAGSTGSVLANRLSHANLSILLIEAGDLFGVLSKVPLLTTFQQKSSCDWQYETTQQCYSSKGFVGHRQNLPRGKGLGGSGQLNYMLHFNGVQRDFDKWHDHGLDLEFATELKNECGQNNQTCSADQAANIPLSNECMLPVTPIPYDHSKLSMAFTDSVNEMKSTNPYLEFSLAKYNTRRGYRFSAYDAYLVPALNRKNLKVLINTRVHKIIFNDKKVYSILVSPDSQMNETAQIRVRKEVILCAGAISTPQILMLSGIGPKRRLARFKIPLIQDAPRIGQNLYDHLSVPLFVTLDDTVSITRDKVLSLYELYNYLMHGEGVFSNFGVLGYVSSAVGEHSVGLFGVGAVDEDVLRDLANYDRETFRAIFPYYANSSQEGLVLLNACNQPISRGQLSLVSVQAADRIRVNPNYLKDSNDVSCVIRAIRLAVEIMSSKPFRRMGAKIVWPRFKNCRSFGPFEEDFITNQPSDHYLECLIRTSGTTAHHPGGTCAIGKQSYSPLDNEFRVRGITSVRVADASVLPTPVSGTPHTVLIKVAEHASNIILRSRNENY